MQARTGNAGSAFGLTGEASAPAPEQAAIAAARPPLTGGRGKDGRAPVPVPATEEVRDGSLEANGDDNEASDQALRNNLKQQVLLLTAQVEEEHFRGEVEKQIEQKVSEVTRMRSLVRKSKGKVGIAAKERDREKGGGSHNKKQQQVEVARREAARSKRMQELIRQIGNVIRQISQHKWAWPFMKPVDVEGLGLHDYYGVVKKPMDLGTIRDKMDAKDGTAYKHVQEICTDVRLVFSNAMTYNQEGTDVHVMAKTLSDKFEEKWKALLEPKLVEEETKRKQEDREAQTKEAAAIQAAEEAATESMATQVGRQLEELDKQLEDLKQQATPKFSLQISSPLARNPFHPEVGQCMNELMHGISQ